MIDCEEVLGKLIILICIGDGQNVHFNLPLVTMQWWVPGIVTILPDFPFPLWFFLHYVHLKEGRQKDWMKINIEIKPSNQTFKLQLTSS